ncbi:hypothetical protein BLA29_009617 [Euroglyphus maynei]|uniref:Kazal-like domain-containing protein n=1 Tax=Euroglyphus maynei TaxID=6958 RepID=A0A1Y3BEW5_EURMA|nr:hypothetical protein BLA29_009617 [Euroglyphus maynei]
MEILNVDENGHTKCVCSLQSSSDVCSTNHNDNSKQRPVCGSNGKLYDSLCELEKYSCFYNIDIVAVDMNFCNMTKQQPVTTKWSDYSIDHNNEYDPVCGSNHQNFINECELRSFACSRQINITILHRGVCGM